MLRHAATAVATTKTGSRDETSAKVTVVGDDDRGRVPLLFVSLIGHSAIRYNVARNPNWAERVPMDSTNRLHLFSHQIQQRFISAGFKNFSRRGRDDKYEGNFLRFNIFNAWKVRASRRVVDELGHEVQERRYPDFDAQGLIEKYKDVVLAEGIPLEKISLCKNGRNAKFQGSRTRFW